jgi:hypothetical protein
MGSWIELVTAGVLAPVNTLSKAITATTRQGIAKQPWKHPKNTSLEAQLHQINTHKTQAISTIL